MLIELIGGIGPVAELGAGHGSAVDGKVDAGFVKFRADDAVLDVVEVVSGLFNLDEFDIPDRIDKGDAVFDILDAGYRVMIYDQFDGECIIGVDPVGELLIPAPVFVVGVAAFQQVEVSVEAAAVLDKPRIVYPTFRGDVLLHEAVPNLMGDRTGVGGVVLNFTG